jgi:hypothetical protein
MTATPISSAEKLAAERASALITAYHLAVAEGDEHLLSEFYNLIDDTLNSEDPFDAFPGQVIIALTAIVKVLLPLTQNIDLSEVELLAHIATNLHGGLT